MNRHEIKRQRLSILIEQTALNNRHEAGEDVSKELLECGKKLDKLSKHRRRVDIMDANIKPAVAIPIESSTNYKKTGKKAPYKRYDISPEIRELAAKNNIKYNTLKSRIFFNGWDEYRAATEPIHQPNSTLTMEEYKRLKSEGYSGYRIIKEGLGTEHAIRKIKRAMAEEKELSGVVK